MTISTSDTTLSYSVDGPDTGTPVVLLHPVMTDRTVWDPHIDRLDAGPIIRPDLRGHGETGGTGADEYTLELFAEDVHEITERFDGAPVVAGCSIGAATAFSYAYHYPEHTTGIVAAGMGEKSRTKQLLSTLVMGAQERLIDVFGYQRVAQVVGALPENEQLYRNLVDLLETGEDTVERMVKEADVETVVFRGPKEASLDEAIVSQPNISIVHASEGGHLAAIKSTEEFTSAVERVTREQPPGN